MQALDCKYTSDKEHPFAVKYFIPLSLTNFCIHPYPGRLMHLSLSEIAKITGHCVGGDVGERWFGWVTKGSG